MDNRTYCEAMPSRLTMFWDNIEYQFYAANLYGIGYQRFAYCKTSVATPNRNLCDKNGSWYLQCSIIMQIKGAFCLVGVRQFYSVHRVSPISSTYMDSKSIFNAKFKSLSNFPSFIKLTSLEIGKEYKINRFSNLKTVYGDRFIVDIQASSFTWAISDLVTRFIGNKYTLNPYVQFFVHNSWTIILFIVENCAYYGQFCS